MYLFSISFVLHHLLLQICAAGLLSVCTCMFILSRPKVRTATKIVTVSRKGTLIFPDFFVRDCATTSGCHDSEKYAPDSAQYAPIPHISPPRPTGVVPASV